MAWLPCKVSRWDFTVALNILYLHTQAYILTSGVIYEEQVTYLVAWEVGKNVNEKN
jgi:hypothetical protein